MVMKNERLYWHFNLQPFQSVSVVCACIYIVQHRTILSSLQFVNCEGTAAFLHSVNRNERHGME